jgi:hypothetical protein
VKGKKFKLTPITLHLKGKNERGNQANPMGG